MSIEERVMLRYPKQTEERTCAVLRNRMQELRELYRQRLIHESTTATVIQRNEHAPNEAV